MTRFDLDTDLAALLARYDINPAAVDALLDSLDSLDLLDHLSEDDDDEGDDEEDDQ